MLKLGVSRHSRKATMEHCSQNEGKSEESVALDESFPSRERIPTTLREFLEIRYSRVVRVNQPLTTAATSRPPPK